MGKAITQGRGSSAASFPGEKLASRLGRSMPARAACPRLEIVDPFHRQWPAVLALVSRRGQRRALMLDTDGWLSARQSVAAAFLDGRAIGFLVFHVEPIRTPGGQLAMSARVDACATEGAAGDGRLSAALLQFAREHAGEVLNCRFFDAGGAEMAMAA